MMKVLVCDDDDFVIRRVRGILEEIKTVYNIGITADVRSNSDFIKDSTDMYDIAVVDVEMPDVNGFELAEKLRENNPDVIVIVITSFSDYLDSAMRISAFRFLSKPIDKERFIRNFIEAVDAYKKLSKTIVVEKADGVFVLKTKDILYIENLRYGSEIVTKNQTLKTNQKLADWYELIGQPGCFVYSHKSYIINFQNVINFDQHTVTFEKGNGVLTVPCVAQRRYTELKKDFFSFIGGI